MFDNGPSLTDMYSGGGGGFFGTDDQASNGGGSVFDQAHRGVSATGNQFSSFNIRGSNLGTVGILESKAGLVAKREDLNFGGISLAEIHMDKGLDNRTMGGLYNYTMSDMYSDDKNYLFQQIGAKLGGMILDEADYKSKSFIMEQAENNVSSKISNDKKQHISVLDMKPLASVDYGEENQILNFDSVSGMKSTTDATKSSNQSIHYFSSENNYNMSSNVSQKNENKNTSGFSKLFEKNKEYKPNNTQAIKREAEPQRIDTLKNDSFANQNRFEAEKNKVVKTEKNFNIPNISSAPLVRKNKISFN